MGNCHVATLMTALREAVSNGEADLLWMEMWNVLE
jgi:hypothetical protein